MVRKTRITTLALFLLSQTSALAVDITFDGLTELVRTKNERIKASRSELEAARIRTGSLARSFLPQLTADGSYSRFNTGNTGALTQPTWALEASINIFNGGRDKLENDFRSLTLEEQTSELQITTAEELMAARQLFWNLVHIKEEIKVLDEMNNANDRNLKSTNQRIRSGVATESDRLEFKMRNLELKQEISRLLVAQKSARVALLVHLGYPPEEPLTIDQSLDHTVEWEKDLQHTHEAHKFFVAPYEVKAEKRRLESKQKRLAFLPSIDLYAARYQWDIRDRDGTSLADRRETAFGVRVTMNLFDGLSSINESQALSAEKVSEETLSRYEKAKNEAHVQHEFFQLESLHNQVHDAEEQIKMAEQYYSTTQKEYSRGAKNSPDVAGASEKLESVLRKRNQILRDFHIARSNVLSEIGR